MTPKGSKNRHLTYLLALSAITLAVYLQALNAGFLSVDDTDTIRYIQSGNVSLTGLFLEPGRGYYRPLALLSLLSDFHLFGGNPAGYHLTNLLLHLANVLLVYCLANLLMGKERNPGIFPFLAALLFAVHPVNSEAVVWISARPDLLCCFFFLLCMVLLVKGSGKVTPMVFTGLFVTFLCSLASKEASLLLPVLAAAYFILEYSRSVGSSPVQENPLTPGGGGSEWGESGQQHLTVLTSPTPQPPPVKGGGALGQVSKRIPMLREKNSQSTRNGVAACSALFLAALVYLALRKGLPIAPVPTLAASARPASHAASTLIDGAAACGFYFRKLLYPFPLNIAISDVPVNICVGIFLVGIAASVAMWMKEAPLRFPLLFLASALIPPLGALFLSLPWTPYAERYLYLPSVAFVIGTATLLHRHAGALPPAALRDSEQTNIPFYISSPGHLCRPFIHKILDVALLRLRLFSIRNDKSVPNLSAKPGISVYSKSLVFCVMLAAIPTAYRVNLWTKPIAFWQDAVAKSPNFGTLRLPLAAEYIEAGRYAEAQESLRQARKLGLPLKGARDFSRQLEQLIIQKRKGSLPAKKEQELHQPSSTE